MKARLFLTPALAIIGFCLALRVGADPSGPFTWGETTHVADAGGGA